MGTVRNGYHLLDICGITRTLIADEEALYDPAVYNDRLLLGLKGTMSEAELYQMKRRLVESVRCKAKRGELRRRLAPGFVWDEAGRIQRLPGVRLPANQKVYCSGLTPVPSLPARP